AHLPRADNSLRDGFARLYADEIADALHRGVAIGLGVVGKKLVGDERAVRPASDHVGEGAAAVDPEIPAAVGLHRRAPARVLAALYRRLRPRRSISLHMELGPAPPRR